MLFVCSRLTELVLISRFFFLSFAVFTSCHAWPLDRLCSFVGRVSVAELNLRPFVIFGMVHPHLLMC